jgi:hypothetical protein
MVVFLAIALFSCRDIHNIAHNIPSIKVRQIKLHCPFPHPTPWIPRGNLSLTQSPSLPISHLRFWRIVAHPIVCIQIVNFIYFILCNINFYRDQNSWLRNWVFMQIFYPTFMFSLVHFALIRVAYTFLISCSWIGLIAWNFHSDFYGGGLTGQIPDPSAQLPNLKVM